MIKLSIEIKRSDKYVDYSISAANNRGYITIDTSDWIDKPWMFYELPSLKFEIYTETDGELVKYQNFSREIRTYNPAYSPLGVLNVTIDIRNVPEEFILRITPIFDNDAVAARNMLVENGIEDGDIWGADQDVPTQLFNLNLEFIECSGEYIPPTPPVPPTHEETITGVPPITFDGSIGEPLISWSMKGNGSQQGTPTPDNPIMPEFVGVLDGSDWAIHLTCAGQTVPVYLGQTQTVRRVRKLVLTGEENVSVTSAGMAVIALGIPPVAGEECVCSHYIGTNDTSYSAIGDGECTTSIVASGGGNRLAINDVSLSTADAYKAFFAQQYAAETPVTVWYVLATPQTGIVNEPLCKIGDYADELHSEDAAITIPTTKGQNTLTVDTPIQPSEITITYMKEE